MEKGKARFSHHFILLVIGQVVSILGTALMRFVLSLYVLDLTGRADVFAALLALSHLPLLLSPVGGALADRMDRRRLMILLDLTGSVIVLSLLLAMAAGEPPVALIGGLMMLLAVVSAIYSPTVLASIPQLVPQDRLEQANGMVSSVQALSAVAAPLAGGILYSLVGAPVLAGASAVALLLSGMLLLFIRIPRVRSGGPVPTVGQDLKDGFAYVTRQGLIRKAVLLAALLNFILTPFFLVGAPYILRVVMESSDTRYGLGVGLIQAAVIVGALSVGKLAKRFAVPLLYRWLYVIAVLLVPLALSLTPLGLLSGHDMPYLLFLVCAMPVAGLMTMISIAVISRVQKETPPLHLGKVLAIITMASQCAAPLGQLVYGLVIRSAGSRIHLVVLMVSAAMALLAGGARRLLYNEGERG
ncbi:MFS transporter [Paenibacillus daejeonensis]|uniref:MFS transporter n=1 Tax=Paenibacillus daejeonensis TaxID=135193 RepID=UPI0003661357|nr:MFS transporter [Paenibacillus daejeonensis]